MKLVVDASVAVKWFFPDAAAEADRDKAAELLRAIRDGGVELVQPPHWFAEVVAVISRLYPGLAIEAIELLDSMDFGTTADADLYKRASRLAIQLNQHVFDKRGYRCRGQSMYAGGSAEEHDAKVNSGSR